MSDDPAMIENQPDEVSLTRVQQPDSTSPNTLSSALDTYNFSWKHMNSTTSEPLYDVTFSGSDVGWVAGGTAGTSYIILYTVNNGSIWTTQHSDPNDGYTYYAISALDSNNVVASGGISQNYGILHYQGGSWSSTGQGGEPGVSEIIRDIHYFSSTHIFATRDERVTFTQNGGANWQTIVAKPFTNANFLTSIFAWSETTLIVAAQLSTGGNPGHIAYWDGSNWWMANAGWTGTGLFGQLLNRKINKIFFIDQDNGWAVGQNKTIIVTSDRGATWNYQHEHTLLITDPGLPSYNDIHFINNNQGWIVGDNGIILQTNDGGINWVEQYSGTIENLNGIYIGTKEELNGAKDTITGFAVGDNGTILKLESW